MKYCWKRRYNTIQSINQYFDDGYVGNQPVAWKECCAEYWFKEVQKSIDRCTGRRRITALNTIQSINQSEPKF